MRDPWKENYNGIPGNIYLGEDTDNDPLMRFEQIVWIVLAALTVAMIISTIVRFA